MMFQGRRVPTRAADAVQMHPVTNTVQARMTMKREIQKTIRPVMEPVMKKLPRRFQPNAI